MPPPKADLTHPVLLVVDDDAVILELIQTFFEETLHVVTAGNGQEALRLAAAHPPHLVLLDLMMPGINGLTLTEELRALPQGHRMRIFIMSAHTGLRPAAQQLGIDGFFAKPFELDEVMGELLTALQPE